jgi:ABC-2 type transport system ATP-binding protein
MEQGSTVDAIAVRGVDLRSLSTGEMVDSLESGAGLAVDVTLAVPVPLNGWSVGAGIESAIGQVVFGTSSRHLGATTELLEGERVFRFEIDSLPLGAGQYFVTASAGTLHSGELSRVPQAATFHVSSESKSHGILSANAVGHLVQR